MQAPHKVGPSQQEEAPQPQAAQGGDTASSCACSPAAGGHSLLQSEIGSAGCCAKAGVCARLLQEQQLCSLRPQLTSSSLIR